MQPISATKERNGVCPLSTISNNSTSDNERKEFKMASNYDDMLVALPMEIRELIIQKLDIAGYHRLGAVCKSWRSIAIAAKQNHNFCLQQLPWLMLFFNNSFQDGHHGFFSLSHGKVFKLKLPEFHGARCCGSSWGWLIMTNQSGENFLLNPFSRSRIQLPSRTKLPNFTHFTYIQKRLCTVFIRKAMLMSPPAIRLTASSRRDIEVANNNCVVVAIYRHSFLVFCRPGDQAWTFVVNSQLHWDFSLEGGPDWSQSSLSPITTMFEVFKLDPSGPRWIKVDSLGDQMLFVGRSNGISLSARHFSGFMGNCIYFTNDSSANLGDIVGGLQTCSALGVFSLEDGTIKSFFPTDSYSSLSASVWFMPHLL
ncbi:hypothetical protein F0562_011803 [Nyssa sinensis]|uniref:F-box domain-containing protein n=1 Tax=Nyssa sinensis TaxID=561372 RepID=A0A5J4ZT74_9ASTE|nr:hypothetical protein F0562_011803 [Nyssa sinensis]